MSEKEILLQAPEDWSLWASSSSESAGVHVWGSGKGRWLGLEEKPKIGLSNKKGQVSLNKARTNLFIYYF